MNKADVLKEIIAQRRSIFPKDYTGAEISREIIDGILQAAATAPNHKRTKPWRFKVFRGEEKAVLASEMQAIYKATQPEHVFLEKKFQDIGFKINKADTVISIIVNFSGIGCYWSSPKLVDHLKESLTIEENQKCLGLFYMGVADI